jgi:plastocyanin
MHAFPRWLQLRCAWPLLLLISVAACGQNVAVTGSIEIVRTRSHQKGLANGGVVVWLTPLSESGSENALLPARRAVLLQKNKTFEPHLLVIPVGSEVDFPNKDPFFHNVFSLFDGKRFDLGLYESGTTRSIRFDRAGVSFLFCNIHSEMSAVIVTLDTPYFSISDRTGQVTIPNVPPGRYALHTWREGTSTTALKNLMKSILVSSGSASFGKLVMPDNAPLPLTHKNKYGQDYVNPNPPGVVYEHP